MKKIFTYIIVILLIVIITVSGTYAYLVFTVSSNNKSLVTDSSKLDVIYTGDNELAGNLNLVNSKEEGHKATVKIKLSEDSVDGEANLYIKVTKISANIAKHALKWEVYRTYNETETFISSGTFQGVTSDTKIYFDTNYRLTTEETSYTVYIWLNGNDIGNDALGGSFEGYIGAEAKHITELK